MSAAQVGLQPDESRPSTEYLAGQVRALEERVAALEQYLHIQAPAQAQASRIETAGNPSGSSLGEAVPVAGRVLLGIAGAYVLRALTESGIMSHAVGVAAGFLYAAVWLAFAARTSTDRKLVAGASAFTSVLILGPLLFEASHRFKAISGSTAAGVIVLFGLMAILLCWNRSGSPVPVIATAGSAAFSLILLVSLRDLLPFTLALLAIAAGVEFAACFDRETSSRPFIALGVNLALLLGALLGGRPGGLPEGYVPVSTAALVASQIALLIIYVASTAARTIVQQRKFTNFETLQTALAFAIGLGGALHIARASGTGTAAIGIFALAGGAACYLISFVFVRGETSRTRNFYTYATFALMLVLSGTYLLFTGIALAALWSAYALTCCWTGLRAERHVLELHAAAAVLLVPLVSGVAAQPREQLFGNPLAPVPQTAELIVIGTAFLACLAVIRNARQRPSNWDDHVAGFAFALTLGWSLSGLVAHGLTLLVPVLAATWGMLALAALSAGLALASVEWRRFELRILVFLFMITASYKLLTVDIHQAEKLALAASMLLYGGTLILLPQLMRPKTVSN